MKKNPTLDYYNKHAEDFINRTFKLDFSKVQDKFLTYLKAGMKVLDLGCGSGRDSLYFKDHRMEVDAVDGSSEICKIASKVSGLNIKELKFDELDFNEEYDGVFACASLLHLTRPEIEDTLRRIVRALKRGGYLYVSFKYGSFSGIRDGRQFTDMDEGNFNQLITQFSDLKVVNLWKTSDVRKEKETQWLNAILQKT